MGCFSTVVWPVKMELPAVYDDSVSFYETVCKLIDDVNNLLNQANTNYEQLAAAIKKLEEYVYGTPWQNAIQEWVNANLPCIVGQVCKWFHFGIDDNGNVVCVIPTTWQGFGIHWNMDYGSPDFGKLTIGWE